MPTDTPTRSSFVDSILALMPRIETRRVKTASDYAQVFKLRYATYRANDLIEANEAQVSIDTYDLLENCQVFGLYLDGELASSIRIHKVTPETPWCPAMKSFGDLLKPRLAEGETFVDGSRFCVDREKSAVVGILPFLTVRIAYMASVHFSSTYNISVVRREHAAFYRRYYGFEQWADNVRLDWYKLPVNLYVGDMRKNRQRIDERLPFMQSNIEERLMLFSDDLPEQGLNRVTGLFGNTATNSVSDPGVSASFSDWLSAEVGG